MKPYFPNKLIKYQPGERRNTSEKIFIECSEITAGKSVNLKGEFQIEVSIL